MWYGYFAMEHSIEKCTSLRQSLVTSKFKLEQAWYLQKMIMLPYPASSAVYMQLMTRYNSPRILQVGKRFQHGHNEWCKVWAQHRRSCNLAGLSQCVQCDNAHLRHIASQTLLKQEGQKHGEGGSCI